ncbi:MAG: flavodoxin family protein [Methanomassiliicoccus sp.]|nr:flavodoxin family protein [Methanomassiliicoccus sp.]
MTILVTYMSVTGNTKKVADAIYGEIEGEREIKPMDQVSSLDGYELSFVGFPIYSFNVPPLAMAFLEKAKGKRVALFYTHASFPEPEVMPGSEGLVKSIHQNVQDATAGVVVVKTFDCRGELAENVARKCLSSDDPMVQMFGKLRNMTLGHPDATELAAAKAFAKGTLAKQ